MGNPSSPTLAERQAPISDCRLGLSGLPAPLAPPPPAGLDLLVASFGDPAAADYADYVRRRQTAGCRLETAHLSDPAAPAALQETVGRGRVGAIVLFLNPRLTERDRRALD